jgi:uncharacterized protein YyaL (SSP411 family)
MMRAGLALASATGNATYLAQALAWTDVLNRHYWSDALSGYYFAADDTSDLILRPFATEDDATPNANAAMVSNLTALSQWTGEARYRDRAEAMLSAFAGRIAGNVVGHAGMLSAAMDAIGPAMIVLIVPQGAHSHALRRALSHVSVPGLVVQEIAEGAALSPASPARGKGTLRGKPTAFVCIGPQCALPVTEPAQLIETVNRARHVTLTEIPTH